MTCLICERELQPHEHDLCATRHTDGAKVCPECTDKVRHKSPDALDKLSNAKAVHHD